MSVSRSIGVFDIQRRFGETVAVFHLSADECEALASWIPPEDGARQDYVDAAKAIRDEEEGR